MPTLLRRGLRYTAYLLAALVAVTILVALALGLVIMPDVDRYKGYIEASASRAVGLPVAITSIEADWHHINPRFSLRGLTLSRPGQAASLELGRVDATVSWLSLLYGEPHLSRLDILRPNLEIRRDAAGVIYVAGIPVNVPTAPSPFPDWLLRQRGVAIADGRVVWIDETLAAPPLVLHHVDAALRNHFRRHRFSLTATPPAGAAKRFDLRADLRGTTVHRLADWNGRIYAHVEGASAAAFHAWAPWAQQAVKRSRGNLRFWLTLADGRPQSLTGDVGLADVAVSLADDLPDMAFRNLSGRLGWQRGESEHSFFVENLRVTTAAGLTPEPANLRVRTRPDSDGRPMTATIGIDRLRLETLIALAGAVPIPRRGHALLEDFNPRGYVEHIEVDWLGERRFRIKGRFRDVGLNSARGFPGISGLSGEAAVDEDRGRVHVQSSGLQYVHDKVFRQPLQFDRMEAKLAWTGNDHDGYRIEIGDLRLANADLEGGARGSIRWKPDSTPILDIQGRLERGRGDAVWRYLPRQVGDPTHAWVKRSIIGGLSPDTRLVLRGPMNRFPFDQGGGEFQVDVRMRDAVLAYAEGWPRITAINGLLTFRDKTMVIRADSALTTGAQLGPVDVVIPDLHHHDEVLEISGRATGPASAFLDFIRSSPVHAHTDRFTEPMRASGRAALQLKLHLPLRRLDASRVNGHVELSGNGIALGAGLPELDEVRGRLEFTEQTLRGNEVAARLYGQPVRVNLGSDTGGRLRASISGAVTAAGLGQWLPAAYTQQISGSAPVQVDVSLRQGRASFSVGSDLRGLAIDLPAPLGKKAEQSIRTTLSTLEGPDGRHIEIDYGDILNAAIVGEDSGEARIGIQFGGRQATPPRLRGISLRGNLRRLDLDAWRRLKLPEAAAGTAGPTVRDLNLTFNELVVMNRLLRDINVQASPLYPGWAVKLAGQDVIGDIEYTPRTTLPGNRLLGYFKKLSIPNAARGGRRDEAGGEAEPGELPSDVEVFAKSLLFDGHELGELNLKATLDKRGMRVNTLSLKSPDARLDVGGWVSATAFRETSLNLRLEAPALGKLLTRLGYPEDVRDGELTSYGTLSWMGSPEDFSLDRLNGKLKTQIRKGRFTQVDPGAARLLTIISLQALPRRIVLDFRDVFSEGFIFDEIQGDAYLDRGVAYLPELSISGPAARVRMNGKIDLARERQELRLNIEPRLDESVAVAGALLGGPAVGVGALVASKILKDPIGKAARFEYLVTGAWDDPMVTKLARPVAERAGVAP